MENKYCIHHGLIIKIKKITEKEEHINNRKYIKVNFDKPLYKTAYVEENKIFNSKEEAIESMQKIREKNYREYKERFKTEEGILDFLLKEAKFADEEAHKALRDRAEELEEELKKHLCLSE